MSLPRAFAAYLCGDIDLQILRPLDVPSRCWRILYLIVFTQYSRYLWYMGTPYCLQSFSTQAFLALARSWGADAYRLVRRYSSVCPRRLWCFVEQLARGRRANVSARPKGEERLVPGRQAHRNGWILPGYRHVGLSHRGCQVCNLPWKAGAKC